MSNFTFSCFMDLSNNSLSEFGWIVLHPDDLDFDLASNGYAVAAIVTLFFLTAIPWNLFVIYIIFRKKLYAQPTIMLMLNLAITNFLLCVLVMPFNIVSGIAGEYIFGPTDSVRCRVCQMGVLVIILPLVSIHTLSLMSVDRFIYLKWPLRYTGIVTPKRMLAAIIGIWMLCIIISLPPLFGFGEIKFSYTVATCLPNIVGSTNIAPNYIYMLLILIEAVVPIVTLFVTYIWIICIVRSSLTQKFRRSLTNRNTNRDKEEVSKEINKGQLCLAKVFGAIFTANLITWIPMVAYVALVFTGAVLGAGHIPTLIFSIAYLSYLSETIIHPIMEAYMICEIRLTLSEYVTRLRRSVCRVREDGSSIGSSAAVVRSSETY